MGSTAVVAGAGNRVSKIIELPIGNIVELDLPVGSSKSFKDKTIEDRLFEAALVEIIIIEPGTNVFLSRQEGVLDNHEGNNGQDAADSEFVGDGVAVMNALPARRGNLRTALNVSLWGSVYGAVMAGSISGLPEKGGSEFINVLGVNGSGVSSKHWVETIKSLGVVAGVKLSFHRCGVGLETRLERSTDFVETGATCLRHIPHWKCRFDYRRPIGLAEVVVLHWEIGLEGAFLSVGSEGQGGGNSE